MEIANLKAITGEEISFNFDKYVEEAVLNFVPEGVPYRPFYLCSYIITNKINICINMPPNRSLPERIIFKLNNVNNNSYYPVVEYKEIVLRHYNKSLFYTEFGGLIVAYMDPDRPRICTPSTQISEFILDFGGYQEALMCPINKTTKFNMCLYHHRIHS